MKCGPAAGPGFPELTDQLQGHGAGQGASPRRPVPTPIRQGGPVCQGHPSSRWDQGPMVLAWPGSPREGAHGTAPAPSTPDLLEGGLGHLHPSAWPAPPRPTPQVLFPHSHSWLELSWPQGGWRGHCQPWARPCGPRRPVILITLTGLSCSPGAWLWVRGTMRCGSPSVL